MTLQSLHPGEHADLLQRIARLSRPMEPQPTSATTRLPGLPGIQAVLFDVYGTLLISASGDINPDALGDGLVLAQAIQAAGFALADPEAGPRGIALLAETIQRIHRASRAQGVDVPEVDIEAVWREVVSRLVAEHLLAAGQDPAAIRRLAVEYECRANPVWPMPGMDITLKALHGAGLLLGIVSNAQFFTPLVFDALYPGGLAALGFDENLCVGSWQIGAAKPSTRLFREALRRLAERHIEASEVLVVGNNAIKDVQAAAQLGCRSALFAGDARSLRGPASARQRADLVITQLAQLPGALLARG